MMFKGRIVEEVITVGMVSRHKVSKTAPFQGTGVGKRGGDGGSLVDAKVGR